MRSYPSTRTRIVKFGFKGIDGRTPSEMMDPAYASKCENCAFEYGCLTGAVGVDPATACAEGSPQLPQAPQPVLNMFYYKFTKKTGERDDRLVARLQDNSIWYVSLLAPDAEWHKVESLKIKGDNVQAVNYNYNGNDRLLFCSKDSPLFILEDASPLYCQDAPSFSCFEMHGERLFGGVNGARTRLWFSDDFDPFNWRVSADEAGYITFDDNYGDILKVVSFLGYLYIFREYAVFRLTAFGKQSEFSLKRVYVDTERISENSIVFCGGSIMFAAGGKLFDFDGYNIRRLAKNLPREENYLKTCAAYANGYYWISFVYPSGKGQSKLYRYEVSTDAFSMLTGINAIGLLTVKTGGMEKVYACFSDALLYTQVGEVSKSGKIMTHTSEKNYAYNPSTLGTTRQKTVRCVNVITSAKLRLSVIVDDRNYTFELEGGDYVQRLQLGVKGRLIGLMLYSAQDAFTLPPITMEIETHAF